MGTRVRMRGSHMKMVEFVSRDGLIGFEDISIG